MNCESDASILDVKSEGHYVYKFLNKQGEVIYVGRSSALTQRLNSQHFSAKGHLSADCYNQVFKVLVTETKTKVDSIILEMILIANLKPVFNSLHIEDNTIFSAPDDLSWSTFLLKKDYRQQIMLSGLAQEIRDFYSENDHLRDVALKININFESLLDIIRTPSMQGELKKAGLNVGWNGKCSFYKEGSKEKKTKIIKFLKVERYPYKVKDLADIFQVHQTTIRRWMQTDSELKDVYLKNTRKEFIRTRKRCHVCGEVLLKTSNRAKYCDSCTLQVTREQSRIRQRDWRATKAQ